jgi:hypothetical protein
MLFSEFKSVFTRHVNEMFEVADALFVVDADPDDLWNIYLESFPAEHNQIYRERREHDCSACKSFIRKFGNVVWIGLDYDFVSIWDFDLDDVVYGPSIKELSEVIHSCRVVGRYFSKEKMIGHPCDHEKINDTVMTWEHFHVDLSDKLVTKSSRSLGDLAGKAREDRETLERALSEITKDSLETTLELISQNSLYKGEEWKGSLEAFLRVKNNSEKVPVEKRDNFCWRTSAEVGSALSRIRNHSIGVLLVDLSCGVLDLESALRRYEKVVAPSNYKRPKEIFTKRMIENAQKDIEALGFLDSLRRRFAVVDDINVRDILFANKDFHRKTGSVFDEMASEVAVDPRQYKKVEKISAEKFISDVIPGLTKIQVLFENRHVPNLVSLIAPAVKGSKSMFNWNNGFSWAYNGNVTDSLKDRVKSMGGNVEGVLRFSIQWNMQGENQNDFDAHCYEPNGNHIFYGNKRVLHSSTGMLDVDIIYPGTEVAVENITWVDARHMYEGMYKFFVHNFSHNGGRTGFYAEVEFDGQVYCFDYNKELKHNESVPVAVVRYNRKEGFSIESLIPHTTSSRREWGLDTNQFHDVSVCMCSPNHWETEKGVGHRHLFFMLKGCKNETSPNGFYNEFLRNDLLEHKRVFAALGGKMKVSDSDDQLSGVGFSLTKRNSIICKLEGKISRLVEIVF